MPFSRLRNLKDRGSVFGSVPPSFRNMAEVSASAAHLDPLGQALAFLFCSLASQMVSSPMTAMWTKIILANFEGGSIPKLDPESGLSGMLAPDAS